MTDACAAAANRTLPGKHAQFGHQVVMEFSFQRQRDGYVYILGMSLDAGGHLFLSADGTLHVDTESPPIGGHRPAINVLFTSAAALAPETVAAVLLTGSAALGEDALPDVESATEISG